jgi:hypothetical protein
MAKAVNKAAQIASSSVRAGEATPARPVRRQFGRSFALPLVSFQLIFLTLMLSAVGCSGAPSGYPDVTTTSELGKSAVCHQCGRPISTVTATHVLEQGSARYVVCNEKCKADILKWHASQNGGVLKR